MECLCLTRDTENSGVDDHPRATAPGLPTGILEGRTGCPSPVKQLQCWGALSQLLCSPCSIKPGPVYTSENAVHASGAT